MYALREGLQQRLASRVEVWLGTLGATLVERSFQNLGEIAFEREGNTLNSLKDFHLKHGSSQGPWLSSLCRIRSTAGGVGGHGTQTPNPQPSTLNPGGGGTLGATLVERSLQHLLVEQPATPECAKGWIQ